MYYTRKLSNAEGIEDKRRLQYLSQPPSNYPCEAKVSGTSHSTFFSLFLNLLSVLFFFVLCPLHYLVSCVLLSDCINQVLSPGVFIASLFYV